MMESVKQFKTVYSGQRTVKAFRTVKEQFHGNGTVTERLQNGLERPRRHQRVTHLDGDPQT
jgi:hypothetical protein